MTHPIDDIFKKGLGRQEHESSQEEWMKAKAILDLEKRKKRFPIWWFGAAAGILIGAIVLFTFKKNPSYNTATIVAESHDVEQGLSKSEIAPLATANINTIKNDSQTENTKTENVKADIADKNYSISQRIGLDERATDEIKSLSDDKSRSIVEETITNDSAFETSHSGHSKMNSTKQIKEGSEGGSAEISINQSSLLSKAISLPIVSQEKDLNPSEDFIAVSQEEKSLSIDSKSQLSLAYLLQDINALEIEFRLPEIGLTQNPQILKIKEEKLNPWSFGMYAAFTIPRSKPSLGFMINRNIAGRWSTSIGAGVAYHKSRSFNVASELNLIDANGLSQSAQLNEDVMFRQITLEIPVNIGYRIGKHSVLAIGLAEINLWSELFQDAIVSTDNRENMDVMAPALDQSDPITIVQQSKTINAPSLSLPKYYIGLGYGFEISKKLSLQTQGLFNLSTEQGSFESKLANQTSTFTETKWHLRTALLLRF